MWNNNPALLKYLGEQAPPEPTEAKKITPQQMQHWNDFIGFIESKGYKGSTEFDKKDQNLGKLALETYKKQHPDFSINYEDVPLIQQGLQDVRTRFINDLKTGKSKLQEGQDAGKDYEKFMPNLSPVDGWLGSKTSSHKFPSAYLNEFVDGKQVTDMKPLGVVAAN